MSASVGGNMPILTPRQAAVRAYKEGRRNKLIAIVLEEEVKHLSPDIFSRPAERTEPLSVLPWLRCCSENHTPAGRSS